MFEHRVAWNLKLQVGECSFTGPIEQFLLRADGRQTFISKRFFQRAVFYKIISLVVLKSRKARVDAGSKKANTLN
jgi:hypothetical protein